MNTPHDGMLLKAPVQLARAVTECWKCHKSTVVVAIIAAQVLEFEDGQLSWEYDERSYVRDIEEREMPACLAAALARLAPLYRPRYSNTTGEATWANGCEHCSALQGSFYLHMEPDSPFFGDPEEFKGELLPLSSPEDVVIALQSCSPRGGSTVLQS